MKYDDAIKLFNSNEVFSRKCDRCAASLERSAALRHLKGGEEVILCSDCSYVSDVQELDDTMLRGSLATYSIVRRDWPTFRKFFDLECEAGPVFSKAWEHYRSHRQLNHPSLKQSCTIDPHGS